MICLFELVVKCNEKLAAGQSLCNYRVISCYRQGEEWQRVRKSIAPKMMRLKTVQENIDNFHAVTGDAITRIIKLKEACGGDSHIPDLEEELKKFSMESKLLQNRDPYTNIY